MPHTRYTQSKFPVPTVQSSCSHIHHLKANPRSHMDLTSDLSTALDGIGPTRRPSSARGQGCRSKRSMGASEDRALPHKRHTQSKFPKYGMVSTLLLLTHPSLESKPGPADLGGTKGRPGWGRRRCGRGCAGRSRRWHRWRLRRRNRRRRTRWRSWRRAGWGRWRQHRRPRWWWGWWGAWRWTRWS